MIINSFSCLTERKQKEKNKKGKLKKGENRKSGCETKNDTSVRVVWVCNIYHSYHTLPY
jgi:hypothetical protein